MSVKVNGFTVLLGRDICEEEAEKIKQAIGLFPDVIDVLSGVVGPDMFTTYCGKERLRIELLSEIAKLFHKYKGW